MYKDTSAIDFGPDWSNSLTGHGPKVGHNELHCCSVWVRQKFSGVLPRETIGKQRVANLPPPHSLIWLVWEIRAPCKARGRVERLVESSEKEASDRRAWTPNDSEFFSALGQERCVLYINMISFPIIHLIHITCLHYQIISVKGKSQS